MKKKTVFVGLSGGVDSAVSAALLKKGEYEVVGVFIKTWHPDFLACREEEDRRDAMRVAAHLDIPFLTFDLEKTYKKEVADFMIREYKGGRTPNPDVMCNKEVKFGAFLKRALYMGADYVATGHYARIIPEENFERGRFQPRVSWAGVIRKNSSAELSLSTGNDPQKDQSYFLWTLRQEQLEKIIFPIGHLKKIEVRKLAKKLNLPVAEKKDSQGICFLGAVDLKEFLKHYIKEKKGKVLNEKGETIGNHQGMAFYTIGERHGFTITKKSPTDKPYYITGKDAKKNILFVSQDKNFPHSKTKKRYKIDNTNWISKVPDPFENYDAQIRYHGELLSAKIKVIDKRNAEIFFTKPVLVAAGQSAVIYDGDICLGGGIII